MDVEQNKELAWARGLYQIGQTIAHEQSSNVQQQLLEHITSFFNASSGCMTLLDETSDLLNIAAGSGPAADFIGATIPVGDGVLGWVVRNNQSLLLDGPIADDPRFKNMPSRPQGSQPVSALCWPLTMDNQVVGAISINRDQHQPPFVREDLEHGEVMVSFVSPVVCNVRLYQQQEARAKELEASNKKLHEARNQLLQSEKMASIGQLAAGVAHEINNPVGYIGSNIGTLNRYLTDLFRLLSEYEQRASILFKNDDLLTIEAVKKEINMEFLREDISDLMKESQEGITRVKQIVQDLKDFSHVDEAEWQWTSLHKGLDSTLNIVNHELKYKAEVVKEYGDLPQIECLAPQLNQVFMNLLVNAAQAIEEQGVITIRTGIEDENWVWVEIKDTGKGIETESIKRIFDPFFTTKPVGLGTGLGLSLSYSIVQNHGGRIDVDSKVGKGTSFKVLLPVRQQQVKAAS